MSSEILQEVSCPNCQNPIDIREHGRHIRCDACSSQFLLRGHLCPQCNSYHREEVPFCRQCGAALTRTCLRCKHANWAGEEYCAQCGEAMDIFELLSLQHRDVRLAKQEQRFEEIRELRALEEAATKERQAALDALEAERQHILMTRLQAQQRQERKLLAVSLGGIVLFALIIAMYVLFMAPG